jgi:peptidoglycan/LPS O-acetylase OafA/YrhL
MTLKAGYAKLERQPVAPAVPRSQKTGDAYRPEIDGLRAVAVAAVILFHYFDDLIPSGWLGVDVFFVISGYVITGYLSRAPKFALPDFLLSFYARRIKRLLPALLVCIAVTTLMFVATTSRPPLEIFTSGSMALIGFSNITLLLTSQDYFGLEAHLNPFTHTWSLGVEEQFYLIYPALFAGTAYSWKRLKPTWRQARLAILLISAASLLSYVALDMSWPAAAFYLMPTRFWELGAGALIFADAVGRRLPARVCQVAPWVAAFTLSACFFLPANAHPASVVLAVASTAVLIGAIRPRHPLHAALTLKPAVFCGLISYSLYLWHWSLLVVGRWTIGDSLAASCVLLAATILASLASYFFVEKPLRHAEWARTSGLTIVAGLAAVLPVFIGVRQATRLELSRNNNLPTLFGIAPPHEWTNLRCHNRQALAKLQNPFEACLSPQRTLQKPNALFLLGDSHAVQLYYMAAEATKKLPLDVRLINPEDVQDFPYGLAEGARKSQLLDFLAGKLRPGDVVAVAFHRGHFNPVRDGHIPLDEPVSINAKAENFVAGLKRYTSDWAGKGIKTVLIQDTPLMKTIAASPACLLQIKLFGDSICRVSLAQDLHTRSVQDMAFKELAASSSNVFLWDPLPYFYRGRSSLDVADESGEYIMLDWNHVTERESRLLAPMFEEFIKGTVLERAN